MESSESLNLARARQKVNEKRMHIIKIMAGSAAMLMFMGSLGNLWSGELSYQMQIVVSFYLM